MKKTLLLLSFSMFSILSMGQTQITGVIKDKTEGKPVLKAVVSLLYPKDSILYKFTRTDGTGKFTLKNIAEGNYIIMVSQPQYGDMLDTISIETKNENLSFDLIPRAKLLQEIIVKSGSPLRIKGDTTIYTADSFQVSANANVEELLKKLPGIQVDKDGKITAMGQAVQKVLVDGEEFFGDDPGMAVKNLRADAVKEVQVFDKKSDLAEFTGIDDGNTQKTINLKLKDNAKHGYFGKVDVLAGPQKKISNRYNDNLMFSSFQGDRKASFFLMNGNIGDNRMSWDDMQKYGTGGLDVMTSDDGGIMIFAGGRDDDEPYVNSRDGFMTNVNAGLNYSNKWSEKYKMNFSPQYNYQKYTNRTLSFTQTQIGDSVLNQNSDQRSALNRHNFKIKGIWDLSFDSANSLKITANSNFYHSESESLTDVISTGGTGTLKNTSTRDINSMNDKSAFNGTILFKHKFKKNRRTLSITANWGLMNSTGHSILKSDNQSYNNGEPAGSLMQNQRKNIDNTVSTNSAVITYTEPLSKTLSLELNYQFSYNEGKNQQIVNTFSSVSEKYDIPIDSLSNDFRQRIFQNIPGAKINFAGKKVKLNIGSSFGFTTFRLRDITINKDYDREYVNFFPLANLTYTYKPNHSIRFNYSGRTQQPTIDQLQPLRNNDNYFNQNIGNPDLKPSFTHNFNVNQSSYKVLSDLYEYFGLGLLVMQNSIISNTFINLDSGKTITQPVNVNGNISTYLYGGIGSKIKSLNIRYQIGPGFNYSSYKGMLNNKPTESKTFNPSMNFWLSRNKENSYDVTFSENFNYTSNTTSQNNTHLHYISNTLGLYGTIYFKKVWSLQTDYQYTYDQKPTLSGKNLNTNIWSARFQRTFRNNEFTGYIGVKDLLNQNIGLERDFFGNVYSETRTDRLKRYFYLGFTWNFKNKGSATK